MPRTILGAGVETTIIERPPSAPAFDCMYIASPGRLALEDLMLRGGLRPSRVWSGLESRHSGGGNNWEAFR
jgi:hypothetical protein